MKKLIIATIASATLSTSAMAGGFKDTFDSFFSVAAGAGLGYSVAVATVASTPVGIAIGALVGAIAAEKEISERNEAK